MTTSATRPGRQDAAALLRRIHGASLFLVALDDERTSYRYHHLVLHVLRAWPVSSQTARRGGFFNTVVTTAPQVTSYLVEHTTHMQRDPFIEQLVVAALEMRATQPGPARSCVPAGPLTAAQMRILKLLPTSTYAQMAGTLCISRETVKTHLRSIYQKLGVASRSEAIERAVDLRLL